MDFGSIIYKAETNVIDQFTKSFQRLLARTSHPEPKSNHTGISLLVGLDCRTYRYWNHGSRSLDYAGMIADLRSAPPQSIFILHACAHNPTGSDPTREQWKEVCAIMKERKLFPIFDFAYQGFASGNLDDDAWAVRYFASQGLEMFVAQSFSKNFGLYNERIGNLAFISHDAELTGHVKSQIKLLVRQTWSNPPQHGARIVATILNDPSLREEWNSCIIAMSSRVKAMRKLLYDKLIALKTPGSWQHIINQIGMFSYTGLSQKQVEHIRSNYHIYMLHDGRINMCALNTHNADYIAEAFHDTVSKIH